MKSDLLSDLQRHSVRRDQFYEEVTGMLRIGDATALFVAVLPAEIRSTRRVVVTDGLFEMFTLQRMQIEFVRRLGASGVPAIYVQTPGAGDGDGDPRGVLLTDRVSGVLEAAAFLESRSGAGELCLVSPRLGAVVVLRASASLQRETFACLWDPLVDLRAYMRSAVRLERASRALSGRPSAPGAITEDGSWRDWAGSGTFGVEVTAGQLEDFDLECSRLVETTLNHVTALAVFVNERSRNVTGVVLEKMVGHMDVVTLGLRDPLQLGLRNADMALDPTVKWITRSRS